MNAESRTRWFRFLVLVMGGGSVYKLANLKDAFYVPMQQFMHLSNTQIGVLLSVNSGVATALFVVGGYLADRYPAPRVIPLGLIGTGLAGLYLSTFPSYTRMLLLFGFLALCADCLCWPALLKAVRSLGGADEQGRMFGFFEGGRGLADTLVAFLALGIFVALGSGKDGFRAAILCYACIDIAVGVLILVLLRDERGPAATTAQGAAQLSGLAGLKLAMSLPSVWLVSLNVFMVYVIYCGLTFFIPYLRDVYGMSVGMLGAYGIINQYGLKIIGGPLGGYLADRKFGSAIGFLRMGFLALVPAMSLVLLLPGGSGLILTGMAVTLAFGLIVFSMRGVFWAPMQEVRVPAEITGSAFGIACLIGYAPGMFAYAVYGAILDRYPGAPGYHGVFGVMLVLALIGFGVATALQRMASAQAPRLGA